MFSFAEINRLFENVSSLQIRKSVFEQDAVAQLLNLTARIFHGLDRGEPRQTEISIRLWRIRVSVACTVLEFNDPDLRLSAQIAELEELSENFPEIAAMIADMSAIVGQLLHTPNPKRERLIGMLCSKAEPGKAPLGVFYALSAGRTPGWPDKIFTEIEAMRRNVVLIGTKKDLESTLFSEIVIPSSPKGAKFRLLQELFYGGRSSQIEILLYSREAFRPPARLHLPGSRIFPSPMCKETLDTETHKFPATEPVQDIDEWAHDAFWQNLHQGERRGAVNLVPAHFVLFKDGTGTFLPAEKRTLAFVGGGGVADEDNLRLAYANTLSDSDWVVLKVGDSEFLLDEATNKLSDAADGEGLLEKATDWKEALDALLVTHSCDDVANELGKRGAKVTAASVRQWVGADVLGPGNEKAFSALMDLLVEKGKLPFGDNYVEQKWALLQELRGVRQKAGNQIRQQLVRKLIGDSGAAQTTLGNRTSIRLDGDAAAELLILRVDSVDPLPAYVPASRICRVDDLRSNRWLG